MISICTISCIARLRAKESSFPPNVEIQTSDLLIQKLKKIIFQIYF